VFSVENYTLDKYWDKYMYAVLIQMFEKEGKKIAHVGKIKFNGKELS
jgi:hypothetical protein